MKGPSSSPSRAYTALLVGVALGCLLLHAGIVWALDPQNRFGRNTTGLYDWLERLQAARHLAARPGDAVFFSNSKLFMLDPAGLEGFSWINAAFGAASIEEIAGYVEAYVHQRPVCVIAVDFWSFQADHPPFAGGPVPPPAEPTPVTYLLDRTMLRRAVTGWLAHRQGKPPLVRLEGYVDPAGFQARLNRLLSHPGWPALRATQEAETDATYAFDVARFSLLTEIRDQLARRGVPFLLVLHPQHPDTLRRLEHPHLAEEYRRFRAALEAAFPDVIDLTTALPDPADFFSGDPLHYRPEGARILWNHRVVPEARRQAERGG